MYPVRWENKPQIVLFLLSKYLTRGQQMFGTLQNFTNKVRQVESPTTRKSESPKVKTRIMKSM